MADAKNFSGTIAADAQAVTLSPNGRPVVAIELTGTWTANLDVKIKIDGTEQNAVIVTSAGAAVSLPLTTNQIAFVDAVGCEQVIVRANGFTSGTAAVYLNATDGKLPQATAGSAVSVSDGSDATFGAKADASAAADNSTASFMSLFKRLLARLTTLLPQNSGRLNVDGAGGTFPVTNANLDAALSTLGTQTTLAAIKAKTDNLDAASSTLLTISDFDTKTGSLTETAPATDTASSGLNGRLQRVAQRLSTVIGLLPSALISNRLDVNLGAAPAFVSAGGGAPAAPTCTFTRGANTTAYTIGDEVGTAGTAPTTVSVARVNGGSGIIQGASVFFSDYPSTVPQLVVLVFSATVTLAGDNAQLNLSDADAAKLVAIIPLTASQSTQYSAGAPVAAGGVFLSGTPARPAPHFVCGGSEVTLYACLITLNAFTAIANSSTLALTVDVEQN